MYISQRFPPHLQHVAALLCESQKPEMLLVLTAFATNSSRVPVDTLSN